MSAKKRARENQEITALMETSIRDIQERFDAVEKITDVAEKILKLQALKLNIISSEFTLSRKRDEILQGRMYANPWAFFTVWPEGAKKKLLKQNPELADFASTMGNFRNCALAMLNETIEDCSNCGLNDLEKIAQSHYFAKALKSCEQLQDIFNAAVIAELGEKKPAAENPVVDENKPASPETGKADKTVVKPVGSYRNLRKVI